MLRFATASEYICTVDSSGRRDVSGEYASFTALSIRAGRMISYEYNLELEKRLMFKIKHYLIPLVGIVISVSSACFATESQKSVASIEKDLLKAVAMLGGEARKSNTGSSRVRRPEKVSDAKAIKDLVGLDLKQFIEEQKTTGKKAKKRRSNAKKTISNNTYRSVMNLSLSRTKGRTSKRYRPCYKYNYHELQNKSRRYQHSITEASRRHGVSENLIKSVITAESCFKIRARSHKGARGLMQLMPATARRFGVRNSYNSHQNIGAGAKYLRWLLDRYRGNVQFALAGYNAGEGKVDRYGGIPPYKETREYVRRVMGVFKTLHGKMPNSANMTYGNASKSKAHYQKAWHNKRKAKQQRKPMNQRRCVEAAPPHLNNITYLKRSGRGGTTWRRYYRLNQTENLANVTRKTGVHINALKRMNRLSSYTALKRGRHLVVWECRA